MKPPIEMSDADREKVKATAKELLVTLKNNKLVLDWRKRQQARVNYCCAVSELFWESSHTSVFSRRLDQTFQNRK